MNYIYTNLSIPYHTGDGGIDWQGVYPIFCIRLTSRAITLRSARRPGGVQNSSSESDTARYKQGVAPYESYTCRVGIFLFYPPQPPLSYRTFVSFGVRIYPICRRIRKRPGRFGYQSITQCGVAYKWYSGPSGSSLSLSLIKYTSSPIGLEIRRSTACVSSLSSLPYELYPTSRAYLVSYRLGIYRHAGAVSYLLSTLGQPGNGPTYRILARWGTGRLYRIGHRGISKRRLPHGRYIHWKVLF